MRQSISTLFLLIILVSNEKVFAQDLDFSEDFIFQIKYGWIPIGKAKVSHHKTEELLRVDVVAYTTGIISWIAKLRDSIRTEIDHNTLKPVCSYIDRREGKFSRREINYFDFEADSADIILFNKKAGNYNPVKKVFLRDSAFDMVSSYTYLRFQPMTSMDTGDSVEIDIFYEGGYYDFGFEFIRKTTVEIDLGTFEAYEAYLLFPISRTFPKPHLVKVWVSADRRRLPLLIEAQMKFGKATCELIRIQ